MIPNLKKLRRVAEGAHNYVSDDCHEAKEVYLFESTFNPAQVLALLDAIEKMKEALVKVSRANFAGPSTDERREWTWATAEKALKEVFGEKRECEVFGETCTNPECLQPPSPERIG